MKPKSISYNNAWAEKKKEKIEQGKAGGRPSIENDVKEAICEDLQAGILQKEIAEKYGVSQATISNIKNEVFNTINNKYQKPTPNIKKHNEYVNEYEYVNDNVNDIGVFDIPPESSGGEGAAPFSTPKPDGTPDEPAPTETPQDAVDEKHVSSSPPRKKKPSLRQREPVNDFETVEKTYLHHWDTLYQAGTVHTAEPVVNWQQSRKLLQGHFKTIPPDVITQAVQAAAQDSFILEGGYSLTTILSSSVLNRLINAHYKMPEQKQTQYRRSAVIASDTMQEEDYL